MYELFMSYGGHEGPIATLREARDIAARLIRGSQLLAYVEIKRRGINPAFELIETVRREDVLHPGVQREHLAIYFDPEHAEFDGKGHCVDIDHPGSEGSVGYRFEHPEEAADFVTEWLRVAAQHHTRRASV